MNFNIFITKTFAFVADAYQFSIGRSRSRSNPIANFILNLEGYHLNNCAPVNKAQLPIFLPKHYYTFNAKIPFLEIN
jgi:hypothetical protein